MFTPLSQCLILLAGSVFLVTLARRLALPTSMAYLLVGLALGPHALGIVSDSGTTRLLAELGVAFLLFTLGLDFSLPRMLAMRREVFGLGAAQVLLTTVVFAPLTHLLGVPWLVAIVLGGALSMSSTAILLQQLTERSELNRTHGRLAFAMLLFQDLALRAFPRPGLRPDRRRGSAATAARAWCRCSAACWRSCGARRRALAAAAAVSRDRAQPAARAVHTDRAAGGAVGGLGVAQRRTLVCSWLFPRRHDARRDRVPASDRVGHPTLPRHPARPVFHFRRHVARPAPARPAGRAGDGAAHAGHARGAQGAAGHAGHAAIRALALQGAAYRNRDVDRRGVRHRAVHHPAAGGAAARAHRGPVTGGDGAVDGPEPLDSQQQQARGALAARRARRRDPPPASARKPRRARSRSAITSFFAASAASARTSRACSSRRASSTSRSIWIRRASAPRATSAIR